MRKLFILSTIIFWLAVAAFWVDSLRHPPLPLAALSVPAESADQLYTLPEVARHDRESDCWMAIENQVYALTAYLPMHPSAPELILPWCGKEASQAWKTKTRGRPHSQYAEQLLAQYRIGKLNATR